MAIESLCGLQNNFTIVYNGPELTILAILKTRDNRFTSHKNNFIIRMKQKLTIMRNVQMMTLSLSLKDCSSLNSLVTIVPSILDHWIRSGHPCTKDIVLLCHSIILMERLDLFLKTRQVPKYRKPDSLDSPDSTVSHFFA